MKRVAITGIGVISPVGTGKSVFWNALLAGTSGIGPVTAFDSTDFAAHIGAEVRDFDASCYVKKQQPDRMGRASQMAIGATRLAIADSGLEFDAIPRRRVGVSMGTTSGEPLFVEDYNDAKMQGGEEAVPPGCLALYPCHVIPAH